MQATGYKAGHRQQVTGHSRTKQKSGDQLPRCEGFPYPPPRVRVFARISFLRVDGRPFGQDFNVSFLLLLELSIDDEGWLDLEVQRGVILKIDGDGVMSAGGEQFDFLNGLAASQREFHETSVGKISFVENKLTRRGGSCLVPFVVSGCFTWADGAFTLSDSHVGSFEGKEVRAASVFPHRR